MDMKTSSGPSMAARIILMTAIALLGCVTSLTPAGQSVRVTSDSKASEGCKFLGEVRGHAFGGDDKRSVHGEENAHNELKNDAGRLGANLVVLEWESARGGTQRGNAFACPSAPSGGK